MRKRKQWKYQITLSLSLFPVTPPLSITEYFSECDVKCVAFLIQSSCGTKQVASPSEVADPYSSKRGQEGEDHNQSESVSKDKMDAQEERSVMTISSRKEKL